MSDSEKLDLLLVVVRDILIKVHAGPKWGLSEDKVLEMCDKIEKAVNPGKPAGNAP